ncbi:MAG: ankyrin repeat domain-containing protein [Alphaproteobacteria bacterium]|nr:ankyrin repeat domain-containing protein [Alphaproteobacteria bacterium]
MAFISTKKTFFAAATSGDLDELKYGLQTGTPYPIDMKNAEGKTALMMAAEAGQTEAIKYLLTRKPDLTQTDPEGNTALLLALTKDKSAAALLLIAAGSDVNAHNNSYTYPIHWAAHNGDLDAAKALAEKGALLDVRNTKDERTATYYAVSSDRGAMLEFLIGAGARTDIPGKDDVTPAKLAAEKYPRLQKIIETTLRGTPAAVPAETPAPAAAPPANENKPAASGETWALMNPVTIAKIAEMPALNRKITEIFNFESRERLIISENLKTGAETLGVAENFTTLADAVLVRATDELKKAGGLPPVMDDKPASAGPIAKLKI